MLSKKVLLNPLILYHKLPTICKQLPTFPDNLGNILKADIKKLESESDNDLSDNLETKKMELETRSERMKGQWGSITLSVEHRG